MSRGGAREGKVGGLYPNRSDMRATQPIRTAPGQPYGEAGQQAAAQAQIPLANGNPAQIAQAQAAAAQPSALPQAPSPVPGQMGSMFDPTSRPNEPVTAGSASGPGPGPEALQGPQQLSAGSMSKMISTLAQVSGSGDLAVLAQHAASMGQ